jgi:hypothetical protein
MSYKSFKNYGSSALANGLYIRSLSATPITDNIFTSNSLTVSNLSPPQNGAYTASSSSSLFVGGIHYQAYLCLNGQTTNDRDFWHTALTNYSDYTQDPYNNGIYQGGGSSSTYYSTITTTGETVVGEWMQIHLPYSLELTEYNLKTRPYPGRCPITFSVLGSNDGTTWIILNSQVNLTRFAELKSFTVSISSTYYSYFRIVFTEIEPTRGDNVNISQWNVSGYVQ